MSDFEIQGDLLTCQMNKCMGFCLLFQMDTSVFPLASCIPPWSRYPTKHLNNMLTQYEVYCIDRLRSTERLSSADTSHCCVHQRSACAPHPPVHMRHDTIVLFSKGKIWGRGPGWALRRPLQASVRKHWEYSSHVIIIAHTQTHRRTRSLTHALTSFVFIFLSVSCFWLFSL